MAGMRVVGVIDLKDGAAVHAVRGERERYRPVRSAIGGDDGDALALARGFRDALGLQEIYVADLDAIVGGGGHAAGSGDAGAGDHRALLRALAREARVMADAGVTEPARARALLELGVHRVIVGTETLSGADALDRLLAALPDGAIILSVDLREGRVLSPDPQLAGLSAPAALERLLADLPDGAVILSVDLREGRVLSPDPQLAGLSAPAALAHLRRPGLREAIVLDLARVGSGAGPDVALIAELHEAFPDLELLAGGGVRTIDDLRALEGAGAAGALVATALHGGVIGPRELAELR